MQLSRWLQFVSAWIVSSSASCLAAGDFFGSLGRDAVQAASAQLDAVRDDANRLLAEGRPAESMAKFEDAFPAANRTAVQSFVLGNVLWRIDPVRSAAAHKVAVNAAPDSSAALLEWAMEQHRDGQWIAALETYRKFSKRQPDRAPELGLAADCALRAGQTDEAIRLWIASERATSGEIADFETLLCEIKSPLPPHERRAQLLGAVAKGDAAAAVELLALDVHWVSDWWNAGPKPLYLQHDLAVAKPLLANPSPELKAAHAAVRLTLEKIAKPAAETLLRDAGLLAPQPTAPANGRVLSVLLGEMVDRKLATKKSLREQLDPVLTKAAETSTDPEFHNSRAWLALDTPDLDAVDALGWKQTKDVRFAASMLVSKAAKKQLTADDPQLTGSLRLFPENATLAQLRVDLLPEGSPDLEAALVQLAKAEFTKLSTGGLLSVRPSADGLRVAFGRLAKLRGIK